MKNKISQKPTIDKGTGIFATSSFNNGEIVYSFPQGKLLHKDQLDKLTIDELKYIDKVGDDLYEVIEPPARFVNHSCDPNVVEQDHIGYALRDIQFGEELMVDYETAQYIGPAFECRCGSSSCRKHIPS